MLLGALPGKGAPDIYFGNEVAVQCDVSVATILS